MTYLDLVFMQYGHFEQEKREYVIDRVDLPVSWTNYLGVKELLKDPSLRIGDVSEQVGFLDLAHFSRVFKKQEGVSANEYRNRVLGR